MGAHPEIGGIKKEGLIEQYFFIHNVYANFFKDALDYFSLHLYPRFQHKIVGTYDKSVQYLHQLCQDGKETDKPNLPAIILNPSGDFELADANAGGKQLWRFPNLAPGLIRRILDPIYQDKHIQANVGFIRIQGDLELTMLLNSFYEYCDLRMLFLQIFAGYERWIYPQFFTTFIILPEEFINFQYSNPYTGLIYNIDWSSAGAYTELVRTTNRNELVLPCNIKPIYKLTGMSDGSNRYGGLDNISEWRLTATIHYEIEVPAFLTLKTDYLVEKIDMKINAASVYSEYDYTIPGATLQTTTEFETNLDETSNSLYAPDSTSVQGDYEYEFNTRYFHIVTQSESTSVVNVEITLPEQILDINSLVVNSKYGKLDYGDHYSIINNGNTLVLRVDTVVLEPNMVLELYVFKRRY